jgi:site-specific DNA-methyltransferase (adenine-specific)
MTNVWRIQPANDKQYDHKARMPLDLAKELVKWFTFSGEVVLDPFAGTGTTMAAAVSLGRRGYGIELSPYYCNMARNRLKLLERQKPIV